MAQKFSQRPSQLLFPNRKNPNFLLAIDNICFEVGYENELENEFEQQKQNIEHENEKFKIMLNVLGAR